MYMFHAHLAQNRLSGVCCVMRGTHIQGEEYMRGRYYRAFSIYVSGVCSGRLYLAQKLIFRAYYLEGTHLPGIHSRRSLCAQYSSPPVSTLYLPRPLPLQVPFYRYSLFSSRGRKEESLASIWRRSFLARRSLERRRRKVSIGFHLCSAKETLALAG